MEFVKCSKDTFLNPLQVVSGIVERRHTLPVLANVLILSRVKHNRYKPPPTPRNYWMS